MSDFIIETRQLSYRYGSFPVLKEIDLQVPKGSIYGFLGPNGAGKTTTIRLLLGLLHQHEDTVFLFNTSLKKNRIAILKRTGTLVEEPSLYEHLTAKENLRIISLLRKTPGSRIEEALRIMQLQDNAHRKVKNFSLGMKQRLALAIAILSEPELLILDEPTNGLDPKGIVEMRAFLLKINKEKGTTIFLSSHLLSEVEKLATHIGILHEGRLHFQGTINEPEQNGNTLENFFLSITTS